MYSNLLAHYSKWFRSIVDSRGSHWKRLEINLYVETPATFRAFFPWLVTRKLYARLAEDGKIPLSVMEILEIYIFAADKEIPELSDAAIDLFFQNIG